jgi:pectinesterase
MDRRRFCTMSLAAVAAGCVRGDSGFDAFVDAAAGDGDARVFRSVQAAIDAAPAQARQPWRVRIGAGTFFEKLVVDKPDVHLFGAGRAQSILSYNAAAGHAGPDGKPLGTWGCASVIVRAPGFRARDLCIENAFDYVAEIQHPTLQPIGPNGAQAVALMLDAGCDRTRLDNVQIRGHQDTLFVDAGRSLLRNCRIDGSVDFVFGAGTCVLEDCEIISRFRPGKERQGFIAAPSTLAAQRYGLVFRACHLRKEAAIAPRSVALGRPWRPTRNFPDGRYGDPAVRGSATFIECWMDDHIDANAWDAMAYTARDGSRVMFDPRDARFGEFGSRGPGAIGSHARPQLDVAAAREYATSAVLRGWDFDAVH